MAELCPHCLAQLLPVRDAYCPECRKPLPETPVSVRPPISADYAQNGSRNNRRRALFVLLVVLAVTLLWTFRDQSLEISNSDFYSQLYKADRVAAGKPGEEA